MVWFAYILTFIIVIVLWYHKKYGHRNVLLSKIPAPRSYPLVNNGLEFINKSPSGVLKTLEKFAFELGPVWRFDFSPFHTQIVIHDPKVVEGILSSQKYLNKSEEYDFIKNWLGTGLLISTGKKWHQRRKIITPTFHFKILEQFVQVMETQGSIFVSILKKNEGQSLDFFPLISLYALDVICESAMGCKINAQIDSSSEYVTAVKEITNLLFLRSFDFIKRNNNIYKFTSMYRREKKVLKILHDFTNSVIINRRDVLKGTKSDNTSDNDDVGIKNKIAFLDLLLQSTIDGQPLTNDDIREEVDTFMFEGHDTTTSAVSFTLFNLAKYPEVQQKVFKECRSVFGDNLEEPLKMKDLNNLNYLELVLKETLRLYPSVPFFARKLQEDATVDKYTFPKGANITISPYFMGRDANIFEDPLKFDPNRFNIERSNEKNNSFTFVPFSAGPRNCVGQKFAMLEMKSIVSKIVRNFELSLTNENEDLELISELILRPENGVNLKIKQRSY